MSEMLIQTYTNEKNDLEETSLIEQLVDVFRRKFSDSKQLHVLGILSYSFDGHNEKFVKIDFSSSPPSNDGSESSFHKDKFDNHLNVSSSPNHRNLHSTFSSSTTSPAILDSYSTPVITNDSFVSDKPPRTDDEYCDSLSGIHRRDRRKCRHPKRQFVESGDPIFRKKEIACTQDCLLKMDVTNDTSDKIQSKIPRLDSSSFEIPKTDCAYHAYTNCSTCTSHSVSLQSETRSQSLTCKTVNSVPIFSVPSTLISKHLPGGITINEVIGSINNKCKVATTSVGLNDIGEFCNILPLSALVNRAVSSNIDNPVKIGSSNSVECTSTDQRDGYSSISNNALSGIHLNPNLAATLSAAFSGSIVTTNGSINNDGTSTKHSVGFSSPTITFTGASGEIIGAIPIASTIPTNAVVTSALPSVASIPAVTGNTFNASFAGNNYNTTASNLASVINSLRSVSSSECQNQQPVNIAVSAAYNPSMVSSSPITLLQSISANAQKPSISIGPTLALIGFNSPTVPTTSVQENSTFNIGVNNVSSTLLTTQLGQNVSNNNAALVAALLRGLVNVKQTVQETAEHSQTESTVNNQTNPLTVLTNSPCSTSQMRPLFASDVSISSLNTLLTSKAPTSNAHLVGTVSSVPDAITPTLLASSTGCTTQNNRNSIMVSYPRASVDMNFLLSSGSTAPPAFNSTISTLNAVPGTFSLQTLPNSGSSGITLTSPLLFHSNTVSSLPTTNSVVTTTCTISVPTPVASTKQEYCAVGIKNTDFANLHVAIKPDTTERKSSNRIVDPTTSAIDRILQTIKGCMNTAENRENDPKSKFGKKFENCPTSAASASVGTDVPHSGLCKVQPMTVCLSKSSAGVVNTEISSKSCKSSLSNGDRLPLPPLNKESTDVESQSASLTKVYRCRYCGKTFNRKFCRERHERLHTGVKPYTCEICDEKFIRLEDKKRHVRSLQHILVGRESALRAETSFSGADVSSNTADHSCILPLLAHTLRNGECEIAEESFAEVDDPVDAAASDGNSNEHGSECDSTDTDNNPEKDVTELTISDAVLTMSVSTGNSPANSIKPVQHVGDDHFDISALPNSEKGVLSTFDGEDGSQAPTSHNLRIRCRSALKETQPESNSSSHHQLDTLNRSYSLVLTKEEIKPNKAS